MFALEMSPLRFAARALVWALVAAPVFVPAAAHAQDADALIKQGVELRRAGKDQAALEQFRRAYDVAPTPRALAQMGLAEQALGRWIDGDAHLGKALEAAQDPWIAKYQETLERSRVEIDKHLGSLSVSGGPEGAELRLDGQAMGTLPLRRTLRLPIGAFTLEASAGGHVLLTRSVSIAPGLTTHEDLSPPTTATVGAGGTSSPNLGSANTVPGVPDSGAGARSSGRKALVWISAGAAVGFTAAGAIAIHVHNTDADQHNASCRIVTSKSCDDLYQRGTRAQELGIASFILAGALGATAAILVLTTPSTSASEGRVACLPDLGHPGATCALRF
jgi:hypothetical protein